MQNVLLANMEGSLLSSLMPFFSVLSLPPGTVVHDVGNEIERVYFPTAGLASLQFVMKSGRPIDTGLIGRDGALGLMAAIGRYEAKDRCVTRSALTCVTISSLDLRRVAHEHRGLEAICANHRDKVLSITQRNAARYAQQTLEVRLANCLLDASDLLSSDTVPFTQDLLAEMLATRRTSVTEAACKLYAANIIDYSRGVILIQDRAALMKAADINTE
jgi:CRP-like cAMP-binding protein